MTPEDFRLGNYVLHIESQMLVEINLNIMQYLDEYEPIPLTEEWMLKFGFENRNRNEYSKREDKCPIGISIDFYLEDKFWLFLEGSEYDHELQHIKHVHQLQNLYFALTNTELKALN